MIVVEHHLLKRIIHRVVVSPAGAGEVLEGAAELRQRERQVARAHTVTLIAVLGGHAILRDVVHPEHELGVELGRRAGVAVPEEGRAGLRDRDVHTPLTGICERDDLLDRVRIVGVCDRGCTTRARAVEVEVHVARRSGGGITSRRDRDLDRDHVGTDVHPSARTTRAHVARRALAAVVAERAVRVRRRAGVVRLLTRRGAVGVGRDECGTWIARVDATTSAATSVGTVAPHPVVTRRRVVGVDALAGVASVVGTLVVVVAHERSVGTPGLGVATVGRALVTVVADERRVSALPIVAQVGRAVGVIVADDRCVLGRTGDVVVAARPLEHLIRPPLEVDDTVPFGILVARVAEDVSIGVGVAIILVRVELVGVAVQRAVVGHVGNAVVVIVGVTDVALSIGIEVGLRLVAMVRTVVHETYAVVANTVAIAIVVARVGEAITVSVIVVLARRVLTQVHAIAVDARLDERVAQPVVVVVGVARIALGITNGSGHVLVFEIHVGVHLVGVLYHPTVVGASGADLRDRGGPITDAVTVGVDIARVADAIVVGVLLVGVHHELAVVDVRGPVVEDAVSVGIDRCLDHDQVLRRVVGAADHEERKRSCHQDDGLEVVRHYVLPCHVCLVCGSSSRFYMLATTCSDCSSRFVL